VEHRVVGRYVAGERIGRGGFGSVHRGTARGAAGFEKPVAIKFLDDHARDMLPRLRDEARLLAHLRHRAIVRVDDLVELDGRWALVMELVDGQDLARILALGPIPARVACELAAEAAAGLDAAHNAVHSSTGAPLGLVHRDVKPSNLRLTPRGEVKLLDFGVAHATFPSREGATRSIAFGSPGYLAPERHDGIDTPRADVYALGVVLAECLLGERLGPSSVDPQVHAAHTRAVVARLPEDIGGIVAAMLAYRVEARPTASEASHRLAALAAALGGPTLAEWAPGAVAAAGALPELDLPSMATPIRAPTRSGWGPRIALVAGLVAAAALGFAVVHGLRPGGAPEIPSPRAVVAPAAPAAPAAAVPPAAPPATAVTGATTVPGAGGAGSPVPVVASREPVAASPARVAEPSRQAPGAPLSPSRTPPPDPSSPTPAATAAPSVGTVVVEGDADAVHLVGPGGTVAPGDAVPTGSWRLVAHFGDVEVHPPDPVLVTAGAIVHVRCLRAVEICKVQSP
jgi:serine/threonine-protein kinase